jgi:methylmalonyl-CoA mutase N-terminal domain/subunit
MATHDEAPPRGVTRHKDHLTLSGKPVERVYAPEDCAEIDFARDIGEPGKFPFTRGVHRDMYRKQLWTMRQFAGFGSAQQTNERFKFLLGRGQTGLSTAFDLPTLMGRDSDDALSVGEVGRCGVAVDSLADFETLFGGIDLGAVSVSMTINAPAAIVLAFYVATADKEGVPRDKLRGTCQNDILKEFHAQNEFIYPPHASLKLVIDTIEFCAKELPQYNPVSISGYHIREAGSTAAQELAFTLGDGLTYAEAGIKRGLDIDSFAPRLSFFFNAHSDFFEEIAKYRAARRMWGHFVRDRLGAKNERSMWLRFHAQTAGCSLYNKQPYVNLMRTAYQAMSAVLGGCQSLHTNSMDETLGLPTETAVTLALRTQQVLAYETGVTNTADPLGGSYFIERMTKDIEEEATEYIRKIDEMGGMIRAIESGYIRREIADSAFKDSKRVNADERIVVGVNAFEQEEDPPIEILMIPQSTEDEQVERLKELKARRDNSAVQHVLQCVRDDARAGKNVMPALIEAAKVYPSVGELARALEDVYGRYDGGSLW